MPHITPEELARADGDGAAYAKRLRRHFASVPAAPPADPGSEFVADAGTADIDMPDEDAADDLVGSDADAAELAALAASNGDGGAKADDIEARLERLEQAQREVAGAVASLGALVAGYLSPERPLALPPGAVDIATPPKV